jgi:L-glyceraldehyde 3-phosphate reductase
MRYNRCGRSGLLLPAISLGLWHNFGADAPAENKRAICRTAFDLGITHFDLANNYGPPPGSAETSFGEILKTDFKAHRDEMIISTKAGYHMWDGPYGEWGSRKYMLASCDQSLKRLGLDYVDIFYSHRYDPDTPLEETMGALDTIVRSGRALYAGISNYSAVDTRRAAAILKGLGTPCLIHQPSYSMINRWSERDGLYDALAESGMGAIVFSPLAQGLLTSRYLSGGIPTDSRAAIAHFLKPDMVTPDNVRRLGELAALAANRGQTLAQMALAWVLKDSRVTSALIGASRSEQVIECVKALERPDFTAAELTAIDAITGPGDYFAAA